MILTSDNFDCALCFENDQDVFGPGDTVAGKAVFNVRKPGVVNGIKLQIIGTAYAAFKRGKKSLYHDLTLFKHKSQLLEETLLEIGNYSFDFRTELPSELTSSFEGSKGYIRYFLHCTVNLKLQLFNAHFKKPFTVIAPLSYNIIPSTWVPLCAEKKECIAGLLCYSDEYIKINASCQYSGYAPGQTIDLDIVISNDTNEEVERVVLEFLMRTAYTVLGSSYIEKLKLAEDIQLGSVEAQSVGHFTAQFVVPPVPPTGRSDLQILDVSYLFKVRTSTSGLCSRGPNFKIPIVISSMPISSSVPTSSEAVSRYMQTNNPSAASSVGWIQRAVANFPHIGLPKFKTSPFMSVSVHKKDFKNFCPRYPVYVQTQSCPTDQRPVEEVTGNNHNNYDAVYT